MQASHRWRKHFPRAQRRGRETDTPEGVNAPLPKRMRARCDQRGSEAAARPAPQEFSSAVSTNRTTSTTQSVAPTDTLARLLATGRTVAAYQLLADTRLFHFDGTEVLPPSAGTLQPGRGLQATHHGTDVYILDTFLRRGKTHADVAPLRATKSGEEFSMGQTRTVLAEELDKIRMEYALDVVGCGRVRLRRLDDTSSTSASSLGLAVAAAMQAEVSGAIEPGRLLESTGVLRIVPAGATAHAAETAANGSCHRPVPRSGPRSPRFLLDMPLPIQFDDRPYVCWSCRSSVCDEPDDSSEDAPIAEALTETARMSSHKPMVWHVTDDDIRRELPDVIIFKSDKQAPVYMTPLFLFEVLQQFYACLNARQLRRQIAAVYCANSLAEQRRQLRSGTSPATFAWNLQALPGNFLLRALVLRGFAGFVEARVRIMRRRQLAYNGQGLRHDGCFWLAKVICPRIFTVAIAFCGVDGSLLDVPVPKRSESWADIRSVLLPLLEELKEVRLRSGCALSEAMPVFHATDTFHKHEKSLQRLYSLVFAADRVMVEADTPKGPAKRRCVAAADHTRQCVPTGEPMHDIINMRKLISPRCNDAMDFRFEYTEIINRLSMADAPPEVHSNTPPPPQLLSAGAQALLKSAASGASTFAAEAMASPGAAAELKQFLSHESVRDAEVWQDLFGTAPPRKSMARICWRAGATLHPRYAPHGWSTKREFKDEVARLRRWYKPGKRATRKQRGIRRGQSTAPATRGRASVWTSKINAHVRRLVSKKRLRGLWQWRKMARALQAAGISVQSGTVPVERLWAQFRQAFPSSVQTTSLKWWRLLAALAYMRFNYRHFNSGGLPLMTEGDSLLAERIDAMVALTRALHSQSGQSGDALRALRCSFESA